MSSILNILLTLVGLKNILRLGNDETRPMGIRTCENHDDEI